MRRSSNQSSISLLSHAVAVPPIFKRRGNNPLASCRSKVVFDCQIPSFLRSAQDSKSLWPSISSCSLLVFTVSCEQVLWLGVECWQTERALRFFTRVSFPVDLIGKDARPMKMNLVVRSGVNSPQQSNGNRLIYVPDRRPPLVRSTRPVWLTAIFLASMTLSLEMPGNSACMSAIIFSFG